jgi:hypothetical protein
MPPAKPVRPIAQTTDKVYKGAPKRFKTTKEQLDVSGTLGVSYLKTKGQALAK